MSPLMVVRCCATGEIPGSSEQSLGELKLVWCDEAICAIDLSNPLFKQHLVCGVNEGHFGRLAACIAVAGPLGT